VVEESIVVRCGGWIAGVAGTLVWRCLVTGYPSDLADA
jgi:hypothetical protein